MCELFGVDASRKIQLNHLLDVFFSHGDKHPHGWGMAFFENGAVWMEKQAVTSTKSARLREYGSRQIMSGHMIAHIRLATKGNMEYENCHPFIRKDEMGRTWTLAHNGTIFEGKMVDSYFYVQDGQTDSERILYLLTDRINEKYREKGHLLDAPERFQVVDNLICDIADGNKLNLLLFDGEYLYVHTNYRDSLYFSKRQGGYVFSTVPLDGQEWKPLPLNTLLAFQDGKLMRTGTVHGYEYVEDPEKMILLSGIFARTRWKSIRRFMQQQRRHCRNCRNIMQEYRMHYMFCLSGNMYGRFPIRRI